MASQFYRQLDLSGGVQSATSHLLRKRNEVEDSINAEYNSKIGAAKRRKGYEKVERTIQHNKDSLYGGVFTYLDNNKVIAGINNAADTAATLRYWDTASYWTDIITDAAPNTRFNCLGFLNELYVAGLSDNGTYLPLTNIDHTLIPSTSRNVYGAPKARFITEYAGELYAINVELNGKKYKDRAYRSSPAIGFITRIQTDQKGLLKQLRVDSAKYLKVGMQLDIYSGGTEAKQVSALTIISVDKKNNRISFADTQIDVKDNDEIWLSGRKGKLSVFWNTDYPTPEDAEFLSPEPSKDTDPEFTGYGKNNNRLYLFTRNSMMEFDGAKLITVSPTVGCVSHESIENIGSWTIWAHTSGVWGYNGNTGELRLLSRGIQNIYARINQANLGKLSGGVVDKVYKLAVGELLDVTVETTSTSTSSTSTSSTSSSTSSTSTSSTSTSSTSTSLTVTTTSTSSTSRSTSSTSLSTSSTSTSSTSTSLSTSTSSTTTTTDISDREVVRLCYDFDLNIWWREVHKREIRFQFNHNMHGYTKPYFTDDTGRLFRDETGLIDNEDPIPMEITFGRNNFGSDQLKHYETVIVDAVAARGASIQYSLDGGRFDTLGQITDPVTVLPFPTKGQLVQGRDINFRVVHNDKGSEPIINGITTYYSSAESLPNEMGVRR